MPRTVSVAITANTSGFTAGMGRISASATSTAGKIKGSFDKGLAGIGKNSASIDRLSSGLGKVGLVAAVGVGAAVKSFANFDAAMSGVKATGSDAAANLNQLRDAALEAGARTKYSATEAAGGIEALAKAGVSANDTLGGGLSGALSLAAAGNLDVAGSAEAAASAMNQFGLAGKDIPHIADLLAQAAGTAQGEVSDMAGALNQSGLIAHQFGLSIDETTEALALFAKNGLVGSDAGTSFKTMLTSLYAPSGTAATALDKLGVSAYDASGAIKPIGVVTDELKGKLDALSAGDRNSALKNIFGSDAIRAGTILLKDGSAGLAEMAGEFQKFGTAAAVAATKMDNLQGDVENLGGSLETALIKSGSGVNDSLRDLAKGATSAVNAFGDLAPSTQHAVVAIGGIAAASALGVAGVLRLATGAAEAYSAFGNLSANTPRLAGALRGLGLAAAAVGVTLIALQGVGAVSRQFKSNFIPDIEAANGALLALAQTGSETDLNSLFNFDASSFGDPVYKAATDVDGLSEALARVKGGGLTGALDQVRVGIDKFTGTTGILTSVTEQFGNLDKSLTGLAAGGKGDQAAASFGKIQAAAEAQGVPLDKLIGLFPQYADSMRAAAAASGVTITSQTQLADIMGGSLATGASAAVDAGGKLGAAFDTAGTALDAISQTSSGVAQSLDDLVSSMFAVANGALSVAGAEDAYQAAVDSSTDAIKKNGDGLSSHTEKGRANRAVLQDLAQKSLNLVGAQVEQGASAAKAGRLTADARGNFIQAAKAAGASGAQARKLADAYGLIPKSVKTDVEANTGKSKANLAEVRGALKGLPKSTRIAVLSAYKKGGIEAAKQKLSELKNKTVAVTTTGNTTGAKKVDGYVRGIKASKTIRVGTIGDTSGARAAQNAVDAVHGKTVTITVRKIGTRDGTIATGGLVTDAGVMFRGPLRRSSGGPVWGAGSATSDSIPAMLSNGEFVVRAAAVRAVGLSALRDINAKGFAAGGPVGIGYATGGLVDQNALRRLIAALVDPFKDLRSATRDVNKQKRDVANAREDKKDADTKKERRKAEAALTKQTGELKDAQSKLKDAQEAFADAARTAGETLLEPYRSKSTDVDDILESMTTGATDLAAFQKQIAALRKAGLSETLIQQIVDAGAVNGGEIASQLLDGGKDLIAAMNKANKNLQAAADALGFTVVDKPKRKAEGGLVSGPGSGTSDSISARLSNGEYVVRQSAVAANRSVLDAINYGRRSIDHQFIPAFAGGGYVGRQPASKTVNQGDVHLHWMGPDPAAALRKAKAVQKDSMVMVGLAGGL